MNEADPLSNLATRRNLRFAPAPRQEHSSSPERLVALQRMKPRGPDPPEGGRSPSAWFTEVNRTPGDALPRRATTEVEARHLHAAKVATFRSEPAHGVSTPSASRIVPDSVARPRPQKRDRPTPREEPGDASRRRQRRPPKKSARRRHHPERPRNRPGLSHPGNAPELPPSGPCSLRRSGLVSEPDPPVPLERRRSAARRLRRVDPSGEAARACRSLPARCALMAFSPLRLSLPLPWSRLPDSSSHVLAQTCRYPAGEPTRPGPT
jgi:hypothetical protein